MPKDRVTLADVAEKADVSTMTVSRVLNNKGEISEETRQHVLRVMRDLDYRPNRIARSLATSQTLRIGVIIPNYSSAYFGAILDGSESVLWESGYHILLCNTRGNLDRERAIFELFEEDRVDGVIILTARIPTDELNDFLRHQRAAVVINTMADQSAAGLIYVDEIKSIGLAVNHLLQSGRKHLAYIGMSHETYAGSQRSQGFKIALQAAGFSVDEANQIVLTESSLDTSFGIIRQLLEDNPQIDGLVCFNDELAARTLRVCADLGRCVPDDVAVIGYDDIYLAELLTPTLTTLRLKQTKQEVGAMAARMLLERMEKNIDQTPIVLNHDLIIRDSAP